MRLISIRLAFNCRGGFWSFGIPCIVDLSDLALFLGYWLDAGTGIRKLGDLLVEHEDPIHVLLTHSHWDHIQGFPFFEPIHQPDREIHICRSLPQGDTEFNGVLEQMNGHNFPLPYDTLPSRTHYMEDPASFFDAHDFAFSRKILNHPGGGYAYRVDADGASLAFVTDNELDPPDQPATSYAWPSVAVWTSWCTMPSTPRTTCRTSTAGGIPWYPR